MSFKTLGNVSARLIETLYNENRAVFSINDAQRITRKKTNETSDLLSELVKRKIISRLKAGKYLIIPQELGNVEKYLGNWFIAAKEVVNSKDYYLSFYSAMDFWGMLTHPITKIFVATPKRQAVPKELKNNFRFVFINKKFIFGVKEEWATKQEKIKISDLEKTILDALFHPQFCGGITEIAKGIFLIKEKIDWGKILFYLKKYNKNIIAKRLGYILEALDLKDKKTLAGLREYVKNRYDLLDPTLPIKNLEKNNWRLIANVSFEEIKKIINY